MTANGQNIHTADHIAWSTRPTRPTAVYPSVLVPCATNRARLGRIVFVRLKRAAGFIVELHDQLGIARTADLLGLAASDLLCRVVEGFAYITGGAWEGINHLARGFVHQIAQASVTLRQHLGLAALQTLPLPRAFRL